MPLSLRNLDVLRIFFLSPFAYVLMSMLRAAFPFFFCRRFTAGLSDWRDLACLLSIVLHMDELGPAYNALYSWHSTMPFVQDYATVLSVVEELWRLCGTDVRLVDASREDHACFDYLVKLTRTADMDRCLDGFVLRRYDGAESARAQRVSITRGRAMSRSLAPYELINAMRTCSSVRLRKGGLGVGAVYCENPGSACIDR